MPGMPGFSGTSTSCRALAGRLSAGAAPNPCPQQGTPHPISVNNRVAPTGPSVFGGHDSARARDASVLRPRPCQEPGGVRGRCSLPSYLEKQLQQQIRPPAHAIFYVRVFVCGLAGCSFHPCFNLTLFWQKKRYTNLVEFYIEGFACTNIVILNSAQKNSKYHPLEFYVYYYGGTIVNRTKYC